MEIIGNYISTYRICALATRWIHFFISRQLHARIAVTSPILLLFLRRYSNVVFTASKNFWWNMEHSSHAYRSFKQNSCKFSPFRNVLSRSFLPGKIHRKPECVMGTFPPVSRWEAIPDNVTARASRFFGALWPIANWEQYSYKWHLNTPPVLDVMFSSSFLLTPHCCCIRSGKFVTMNWSSSA